MNDDMFIVYAYSEGVAVYPEVRIRGLYRSEDEAKRRQVELCGHRAVRESDSMRGDRVVSWIVKLNVGDANLRSP